MYCFNFCVHSTLIAIKLASVQRDSMVPCSQLKLSPRHCPLQKMQIPEPPQRCPTVIATVRNIRYQIPLERVHSATCCCRGRQMADGIHSQTDSEPCWQVDICTPGNQALYHNCIIGWPACQIIRYYCVYIVFVIIVSLSICIIFVLI